MTEVISVRFKNKGKVYFFDPAGLTAEAGDFVIVETSKGLEYAECTCGNHMVDDSAVIPPLRPAIRLATEADNRKVSENRGKEEDAFKFCQKKIEERGLDMKLVDVEFSFDGNKILFFFTSDGRVDFRELVKDLASVFRTRIELRQIGVRDEARMLGGLGICGKPFCCSQFLDEFHPVSIKMAKTQGLSLNPTKISGTCGRLMCCLKYEECAYEDLVKKAPKVDAFVETPSGKGSVVSVNLLRGNAKIRLEDGNDTALKTFTFDELNVLGGKARRAEYIAAKAEGRLEEAGFTEEKPAPAEKRPNPRPAASETTAAAAGQENVQKPRQKPGPINDRNRRADAKRKIGQQQRAEQKQQQKPGRQSPPAEEAAPSGEDGQTKKFPRRHRRGGRTKDRPSEPRPDGEKAGGTRPNGGQPE